MSASPQQDWLPARVAAVRKVSRTVREFTFEPRDGTRFPDFTPGSHIGVRFDTEPGYAPIERFYSLIEPELTDGKYRIAVLLVPLSAGGSSFLHHRVREGVELHVQRPRNLFAMDEGDTPIVLMAAGIGITPIIAHLRGLDREGLRRVKEVHYIGQRPEAMPYLEEVADLAGNKLTIYHTRVEGGKRPDLKAILERNPEAELYVCGPERLLRSLDTLFAELGRPKESLHYERFSAPEAQEGDMPFEVVVQSDNNAVVPVDRDETILEALENAGYSPSFSCRTGICSTCAVEVIEGTPDHRDSVLTEEEKASGKVICTCISRSHSARLVLEL